MMRERKFLFRSSERNKRVIYTFDGHGRIKSVEMCDTLSDRERAMILGHAPLSVDYVYHLPKVYYDTELIELGEDTSFETFWNKYNYKLGNKKKTQRLWEGLSEEDRINALATIPKYKAYMSVHPEKEYDYPETWLAQKKWENYYE